MKTLDELMEDERIERPRKAAPDLLAALEAMVKAGEYHFASSGWPARFHAGALTKGSCALVAGLEATGDDYANTIWLSSYTFLPPPNASACPEKSLVPFPP